MTVHNGETLTVRVLMLFLTIARHVPMNRQNARVPWAEIPVKGLVTHRFSFSELPEIYQKLEKGALQYIQIILNY